MKNFTVHIIGCMPEELTKQLKTKLNTELVKLDLKPEVIQLDEKKHISAAYHETFNGEMLIIYGIPYNIPHFGSLSQDLFGLVEDKQTKSREYPKKIYIYARTEKDQKAWQCYLDYLIHQFRWSGTQVTVKFPKPEEILKNTFIISTLDKLVSPTNDEIKKLNSRSPVENIVYDLNSELQQRFAKKYSELKGTQLLYLNEYNEDTRGLINFKRDQVIATVISCASPLQPYKKEYEDFMQKIGEVLAKQKVLHVFGGSPMGIMWRVAKGSIDAGGEVFGVMGAPQCDTYSHQNPPSPELKALKKFIFAPSLQTRIKILMNIGDITIMLPAGTGTFEELTAQLADTNGKPVVIVKVGNHLDHVEKHIRELQEMSFLHKSIYFIANEQDINDILVPLFKRVLSDLKQKEHVHSEIKSLTPTITSLPIKNSPGVGIAKPVMSSNLKWVMGGSILLGAGLFALRHLVKKNQISSISTITPSR